MSFDSLMTNHILFTFFTNGFQMHADQTQISLIDYIHDITMYALITQFQYLILKIWLLSTSVHCDTLYNL